MKLTLRLCTLLCIVLSSLSLKGQNKYNVEGIVIDSSDQALVAASVVILNASDSVLVTFALTNDDGKFKLCDIKEGNYAMQITYVGYGTFSKTLLAEGPDKTIDFGEIRLSSNINKLSEVVVKAEFIPIVIKKDTVEYTADAFKVKPNASVEDLLKKMPGIEVEDDGSIKAQGEDVQSVTVDGKKFFGDDPKMATKNLPADVVNKVQVIDKKSEKAEFTGIDDGETSKSINLELKEDKKVGLFGDVKAGVGTDSRFDSKLNINKFSDKYQLSAISNYNNLNKQGFSFSDYYSLTGGGRGGSNMINNGGFSPGLSKSLTGGLNFTYNFSPKYDLTSSYFIGGVNSDVTSLTSSEIFNNKGSFLQDDSSIGSSQNNSHNFNIGLEAKPDSVNKIKVNAKLRYRNSTMDQIENSEVSRSAGVLSNTVDQTRIGENKNLYGSYNLEYGRRLNKVGRTISLSSSFGQLSDEDELYLDQENERFDDQGLLRSTEQIIQDQISNRDNGSYDIRLSYTEPIASQLYLDVEVRRNNVNNSTIKDFFDLDPLDQDLRTLNDALSTTFENDYTYTYAGLSLQKNTDLFSSTYTLDFKNSKIDGEIPGNPLISNSFNYFLPKVIFNFSKKRLRLQYSTRVNEPSITQLSPIPDNSNPNSLYLGNPDLKPEYSHRLNMRYYFFDNFTFRNFFASLNSRYTLNDIVNSITFDENLARVQKPINVKNQKNISTSLSYSAPIRTLKIKTRLRSSIGWTNGKSFFDGIENEVTTSNQSLTATFENLENEVVSIQVSGNWRWNQTSYNLSEDRNQGFLTQVYKGDLLVDFGKGWTWDNELRYTIYSEETYGSDNTITLWNMGLNKTLFNDRLSLKLSAFDILDQNQGINRSNTATEISETITNSLTRYFMISANYILSSFGGNKGFHFFRH